MRWFLSSLLILACSVPAFAAFVQPPATAEIKIDQVGYLPASPKIAFVVAGRATGEFLVRRVKDGKVAWRGTVGRAITDTTSGDSLQALDFTRFDKSGAYYLDVAGVGSSWPFKIGADVYTRAYYLATRSFYGQRCGTAVDLGKEFPGFAHDACHLDGAYHASSGHTGPKTGGKGWHDAGDYGRYVVNSGITTGTLLWTYELYGNRVGGVRLALPESGNGTPDLLNEIRWNLDWMLSMQDDDGGVFQKQTSEQFCGFVMPEKDTLASVVIGTGEAPFKSSCATADFAAVMAIAARVYLPFDGKFASTAGQAARKAFAWVEQHPAVPFANPKGITTGAYGDRDCSDEIAWAAAELWRTTKEPTFEQAFASRAPALLPKISDANPPAWANVAALGLWTYLLGGGTGTMAPAIRSASLVAADAIVGRINASGYRHAMLETDFVWGSNGVAANYGLQLLVAHAMTPDAKYRDAAAEQLHYLLGRNAFSISWVTQVGANPVRHPHHRPSGADENAEPWPGLLSGGPDRRKQDPAMQTLPDVLPPAKMFLDEQESFATNETAINWNAPLVFLLAAQLPAKEQGAWMSSPDCHCSVAAR